MKKTGKHNRIINSLEASVFRYAIFLSFAFRSIRTVHEFLTDAPLPALALGIVNLLLLFIVLRIHRTYYAMSLVIFYSQILVTSFTTWNSSGGWDGVVPYILMIVIVGIVITSHGTLQLVLLLGYGLALILLSSPAFTDLLPESGRNLSLLSMEFDFLITTLTLVLIALYLKNRFLNYRTSVEDTNTRLKNVSETLAAQTETLSVQQAELNAIKDKLEATAALKVREASTKAKVLNEYAFVNAHQVRGPLARVLGLIHLIELETPAHERSDAFRRIKTEAQEMDVIIQRINDIIG